MKRPQAHFHVKRGDVVKVLTGDYRGVEGLILKVIRKKEKVHVEGVPPIKKAVKPSQERPEGGFIEIGRPIHISNVKKVEVEKRPSAKKKAKKKVVEKKK
jgi:large subunit ribosomal protein L24